MNTKKSYKAISPTHEQVGNSLTHELNTLSHEETHNLALLHNIPSTLNVSKEDITTGSFDEISTHINGSVANLKEDVLEICSAMQNINCVKNGQAKATITVHQQLFTQHTVTLSNGKDGLHTESSASSYSPEAILSTSLNSVNS